MTYSDWINIAAVVIGPLAAVLITIWRSERQERSARRMDVFRTLMRTRRTPTFAEHVGALNLIEIEFAGDKSVIAAWKDLFRHFGDNHTRHRDEDPLAATSDEDRRHRNDAFDRRLMEERAKLLAKLLHAMAGVLGFKIEQLEIFEGGYTPQGWGDEYAEVRAMRRYVLQLALGVNSLPVRPLDASGTAPGNGAS